MKSLRVWSRLLLYTFIFGLFVFYFLSFIYCACSFVRSFRSLLIFSFSSFQHHTRSFALKHTIETNLKFASRTMFKRTRLVVYCMCIFLHLSIFCIVYIYMCVFFCSLPNKQQHNRTNNTRPTEWMSEITNNQAGKRFGVCDCCVCVCAGMRVLECVYVYEYLCLHAFCKAAKKTHVQKKRTVPRVKIRRSLRRWHLCLCACVLVFMMMFNIQLFAHLKYKPSCVYNTSIHCARLLARLSTDVLRWGKEEHKQSYMCQMFCFGFVYVRSVDVF